MAHPRPRSPGVGPAAARGCLGKGSAHGARPGRPKPCAGRSPAGLDASAFGRAFRASPTATIVTDDRLHIVAANPAYERLTGSRRSDWKGARPPVDGIEADVPGPQAGGGPHETGSPREVLLRCADGSRLRVWMSWACLEVPHGAPRLHVATLCERGRWDDELALWRHQAHHDALTGLPNRQHLECELLRGLERAARRGHRLAVLFLDLDGFKPVNDVHGHAVGDRLLARVGSRLREALRAEDFVARYGGDEFVALLEAPRHAADAAAAARALIEALSLEPAVPGVAGSTTTASIGIALYPDHAGDAGRLLQVADEAMYQAKREGGGTFAIAAPVVRAVPSRRRPREAA